MKNSYTKVEGKTCFFITPLGANDSEIREEVETIIDTLIRPVVEDRLKMKLILPHTISKTGSINDQIIEHLLYDDLVIANLTGNNSNVMYELGIRHAVKKHVIKIAQEGTLLPFDIAPERTIFFKYDIKHVKNFLQQLHDSIIENLSSAEKNINNPVYRVHDNKVLKDFIGSSETDIAGILKEIHSNVSTIKELNDFQGFTYKLTYKGVIYQAGLELEFKCKFAKKGFENLDIENLREIEDIIENKIRIWGDQGGGYGSTQVSPNSDYIEIVISSGIPLYEGRINKLLQEIHSDYEVQEVIFLGTRKNNRMSISGS
jgi:hypothetical protein